MTYLAIGLAVLLFVLARAAQPVILLLALSVLLDWLLPPPPGGRRWFSLRQVVALLTLLIYPVNVFDIAAAALVLWAALH